ncbi:MAG: hypothetical protein WDZ35_04410 [Crocinitomicaceae bacterium]
MRNLQRTIAFTFILLALIACKKEKTNWNTNWTAPLVHGRLTLNDLIPPEYTTSNSQEYLSIIYNESVFSFSLDTLIELPDTTIIQKTAVNFSSITVNPAFTYGDDYDQKYELGEIELKRVIVKSGEIEMTIKSPWPGKATVAFDFPTILDQGSPFYKAFNLDAGTQSNPSTASEIINISGFDMDLTGISGNLINTISGDIIVSSNEDTDSYTVTNQDSIVYEVTFKELIPDYAKGYFGSYTITDTTGFDLPFMNSVLGGSIDIDSIDLNIIIKNGFNLIAQAKISQLKGYNSKNGSSANLSFPLLGSSININPSSGGLYDYVPSEYPIAINNSNSTITSFIENLPDSIYLGYELKINPDGNVTAGSDELFPGSLMEIVLNGEFPLEFGANDLLLTDTFNISYNTGVSYTENEAEITLSYQNGFPIGASASLYLLNEYDELIDSLSGDGSINAGMYDPTTFATQPSSGTVIYLLSREYIENIAAATKIAVILSFSSDNNNKVKIKSDAYFDFNLRSNLDIDIHL